jgi:arylsulfatase A-like enzyme
MKYFSMNAFLQRVHTFILIAIAILFTSQSAFARGKAEHVVLLVWDGMRPDFITPQHTPTLYRLATNGVFFKKHHPAYISSTEVNGTAIATGMHPSHSGIMANVEYRAELGWLSTFATESLDAMRRGDFLSDGNYLLVPTVAEILHEAGVSTVVAGTKPVVLLHDRAWTRPTEASKDSVLLFEGKTIPRDRAEALKKANDDKPFPTPVTFPNTAQDTWTTKSLTHVFWRKEVPKFSVLWLSEPDKSQHETGVGSDKAVDALESSDQRLKEVIKVLEEKRVLEKTDIFIVSDHGFSTINRGPDITAILKRRGFNATKKFDNPEPGDVLVTGLGGSASFYVMGRVESVIRELVEFLQTTDFTGVIFSRLPIEGTFSLQQVRIGTTNHAPDVVISMRWSEQKNDYGAPGLLTAVDGTKGHGTHASLSRYDMRNTLVASGPDFKRALLNEVPSGNIDLVPTILWIMGVTPPHRLDGRVLHEALADTTGDAPRPLEKKIEATRDIGFFRWRQYLKFTEVDNAIYFDEGNGEAVLR